MITYLEGDIFDSPAQVIVNTVNTVGVMGKGLALSFKKRYPNMFERYKLACDNGSLTTGKLMLFYEADHWLLLFPTKRHWRYPSKLEYIEAGLQKFVATYADKSITSIAFPRLGCGNGELNWDDVRPIMVKYLNNLPIPVYIYTGTYPDPLPEHRDQKNTLEWLRLHAKDMSFTALVDDLVHLNGLLPYNFEHQDSILQLHYGEHAFHFATQSGGTTWKLSEQELHEVWDELRSELIVDASRETGIKSIVYSLLYSAGYLSRVRIFKPALGQSVEGYQLNKGLGKIYDFKEP